MPIPTSPKSPACLWEGFGFGWAETAYSGVTFPLVEPGLEHAARLGYKRIVVFPYFLFTGILVDRIYNATMRSPRAIPKSSSSRRPTSTTMTR
jgi:sirohydrochlorin cobaltochelatase